MPPPKTPLLTVDCVVFNRRGEVLLIERKNQPFKGRFALPGGFVDVGETVEEACRRELMEETGVTAGRLALVGVYSDPKRSARAHGFRRIPHPRTLQQGRGGGRCGSSPMGRELAHIAAGL